MSESALQAVSGTPHTHTQSHSLKPAGGAEWPPGQLDLIHLLDLDQDQASVMAAGSVGCSRGRTCAQRPSPAQTAEGTGYALWGLGVGGDWVSCPPGGGSSRGKPPTASRAGETGSQLGGLMTSRPPSSFQRVPGLLAARPGSGPVKDRPSASPTHEDALHPGSPSGDLSLDIWAPKAKGCVQAPQSSLGTTPALAEGTPRCQAWAQGGPSSDHCLHHSLWLWLGRPPPPPPFSPPPLPLFS